MRLRAGPANRRGLKASVRRRPKPGGPPRSRSPSRRSRKRGPSGSCPDRRLRIFLSDSSLHLPQPIGLLARKGAGGTQCRQGRFSTGWSEAKPEIRLAQDALVKLARPKSLSAFERQREKAAPEGFANQEVRR